MGRRLAFYHGTHVELAVGEHVLPPEVTGVPVEHPSWNGRPEGVTFASSNESKAWRFAERAAMSGRRRRERGDNPRGSGRARVYRVEPVDYDDRPVRAEKGVEHRRHPEYVGTNNQEWTAPAFRVAERIDVQPPPKQRWHAGGPGRGRSRWVPETRGNQGTLPLDWSPFASGHPGDVNHPHADLQERAAQRIETRELHRSGHFEQGTLDYPTDPRWVTGQHPLPGLEPGGKLTKGLRKGRRRAR